MSRARVRNTRVGPSNFSTDSSNRARVAGTGGGETGKRSPTRTLLMVHLSCYETAQFVQTRLAPIQDRIGLGRQRVVDSQNSLDWNRAAIACCRFVAPVCNGIHARLLEVWTSGGDHLDDSWYTIRANRYIHRNRSLNVLLYSRSGIFRNYFLDQSERHGIHAASLRGNSREWAERIWRKLIS